MYLPIGLFGVSIGTAVLPAVSRYAAVDDTRRHPRHGLARPRDDADAQRAGDARTDRARHANRPAAVRARTLPAGRHRRDRGGAALLCASGLVGYSAARIVSPTFYALGRAACRCSSARATIARQRRAQRALVRCAGISRAGARDVDRGARERGDAGLAAAAPARTAWTAADCASCFVKIVIAAIGDGGGGSSRFNTTWIASRRDTDLPRRRRGSARRSAAA